MKKIENEVNKLVRTHPSSLHSTVQNGSKLSPEIQSFIKENKFLENSPDYCIYLKNFGGISFLSDEYSFSLYGFDENVTLHIRDGEGPVVNKDGYFCIGDYTDSKLEPEKFITAGFFYKTIQCDSKVYYNVYDQFDNNSGYAILCQDFGELVTRLTENNFPDFALQPLLDS